MVGGMTSMSKRVDGGIELSFHFFLTHKVFVRDNKKDDSAECSSNDDEKEKYRVS